MAKEQRSLAHNRRQSRVWHSSVSCIILGTLPFMPQKTDLNAIVENLQFYFLHTHIHIYFLLGKIPNLNKSRESLYQTKGFCTAKETSNDMKE